MSDETQQGEALPVEQPSAEDTAADSQPVEQPVSQAPEGQPAEPAKTEPSPAAGEPAKPQEPGPKQEFKPSSRRSAQYRIQQLADENRELKRQLAGRQPQQDPEIEGDPQPTEQPDINKQVSEEVNRRLDPVLNVHRQAADDQEISELFSGDNASKRASMEPRIREAWKLDQYKELAASDVYKVLNYDADLAAARVQAVEEYKKAAKEAKDSSGSGASARKNSSGEQSAWDLPPAEFKKKTDAARMS